MAIGDDISQPIPAVSTAGTTYASQLVAFLQEVKSRLEARVPLSSLLAGLFDMDNNAISNVQSLGLYEQTATPTSPIGSIQNYQGNLWYVSSAGAAQITSGNSLNAAAVGGFVGDYGGGNPASARFVDADQTFYFYDDYGGLDWARLAARSLDIYGTLDETERVRLTWGGGANWTVTLPTAAPASTSVVQMDSLGNLTASNTVVESLTLAGNKDVTISGTGRYKHGERVLMQPPFPIISTSGTVSIGQDAEGKFGSLCAGGAATWYVPIVLPENARIESITCRSNNISGGLHTYGLAAVDHTTGVLSHLVNTTSAAESVSIAAAARTLVSTSTYYIRITAGAGGTLTFLGANISYSTV